MRWSALALAGAVLATGCVQHAVLENDVRSAEWKARTLTTASNLRIAEAALSAQLVELEALYQRNDDDPRIRALLSRGYGLLARGFIEARRLEALAEADDARAELELRDRRDAEARARYYRGADVDPARSLIESELGAVEAACQKHDRAAYERVLTALLAAPERAPEERLERALLRRLARSYLAPRLAERCLDRPAARSSLGD